jgi:triosephosphate isomerase
MVQRPVLAANWKMHHGPNAASEFMRHFLDRYQPRPDRTVIFFPPAVSLASLTAFVAARNRPDVLFGVQNIHWAEKGAFTGEISAVMAKDAGARMILVGHSERRHVFGETDAECAKKCVAAARVGLPFLLCVGEKMEEREAGETAAVVARQLRQGVAQVPNLISTDFLLAYEPVWAIGTGMTATPVDASAIHTLLRSELDAMIGTRAEEIPILYGGSVSPANAGTLLGANEIDGLLVGGSSLDVSSWIKIAEA